MTFKPMNTKDESTSFRKTLLYATHGWGKTTQAKHYQKRYGKGFIISGEAGLSSIRSAGIDYLPFSSFAGAADPANGVYSFAAICQAINSPEFKAAGYKWLMLDSLTELSDMVMQWSEAKAAREAADAGKKVNGFDVFRDYGDKMIGACKFIRDLPYHVVVSALAKEKESDDGATKIVPMVQGNAVAGQIPGIFDNVFCGLLRSEKAKPGEQPVVQRLVVTGNYLGWQGKVRDEHGVVSTVEQTGNVCDVLAKIEAAEAA